MAGNRRFGRKPEFWPRERSLGAACRRHPGGAAEAKTKVGGHNDGWRTKRTVIRRSGDKTPGFRVTGFLLWNGRFGLARDGRFGQRSLLFAFLFKTKGVLTWELYKCSVHLFMVSVCRMPSFIPDSSPTIPSTFRHRPNKKFDEWGQDFRSKIQALAPERLMQARKSFPYFGFSKRIRENKLSQCA